MITISNISTSESMPIFGPHTYEIRVNNELIALFTHLKQPRALSKCLRDAADAIDEAEQIEN